MEYMQFGDCSWRGKRRREQKRKEETEKKDKEREGARKGQRGIGRCLLIAHVRVLPLVEEALQQELADHRKLRERKL